MIAAFVLLLIGSAARLLLQSASMPPYAGLDELFHVARLAFLIAEDREPNDTEKSIPPYLASSIYESPGGILPNRPAVLASFALAAGKWPGMVGRKMQVRGDVPLAAEELHPYFEPNYEAQQPTLYYRIHAPLVGDRVDRTAAGELRTWRRASVVFALITVFATAVIGYRCFGLAGILSAALLVSLPTWQTLVTRVGNDALACGAIAVAMAITISAPSKWFAWVLEGVSWGIAAAVKLYAWPLVPLLTLFWWKQRAPRARVALVVLMLGVSASTTMVELRSRTSNALGLFAFDPPAAASHERVPIDVSRIIKITVATGIWTSGQHGNALTTAGMALYTLPIAFLSVAGFLYGRRLHPDPRVPYWYLAVALALFACAQGINMGGYLRQAIAAGEPLPAGGKEGWYWYSMAPLLLGVGLAAGLEGLRDRSRLLLSALVVIVVGWDLRIAEGALFRDYAALSSPETPSMLFRWAAPRPVSLSETSSGIRSVAVDPLSAFGIHLRAVHIVTVVLLTVIVLFEARRASEVGRESL